MNTFATSLGRDDGAVTAWLDGTGFGLLVAAALVGAAVAWLVRDLVRRSRDRVADTRLRQMSSLIEHANGLLWEADVLLESDDWTWHMRLHPSAFCRELFQGRLPQPKVDLWVDFQIDNREEMERRARAAMVGDQAGYEQEFRAVRAEKSYWLHESVSITRRGSGRYWLVGLVTDITAQREAEAAQRMSEQTVERIMAQAQCMIWRAAVIEEAGTLRWQHFEGPRSQLTAQLFGEDWAVNERSGFWDRVKVDNLQEMHERSMSAIRNGASGYEQRISLVNAAGRHFWLQEQVSITKTGDRIWVLVGVLTDVTPQVEAQEALQRSEQRLAQLLERTDSTIWQARVERKADGALSWAMFIPQSKLYRRVFGVDPEQPAGFRWKDQGVPEADDMLRHGREAILGGASGYEQVFHVNTPQGGIWLSESVAITPIGPDVWDLVGIITDITGLRQAEAALRQSELRLTTLLDRADCMIWQGEVRRLEPEKFDWKIFTPRSQLYRRIFGHDPEGENQFDWAAGCVPEFPQMQTRVRRALVDGAPGYEQVFQFQHPEHGPLWLREQVSIRRLGPEHWELTGIVIDITQQKLSETAREVTEGRLRELLQRADCLLWEAVVDLTRPGWKWQFDVQPSLLRRRLLGDEVSMAERGLWRTFDIPERDEMNARCQQAMEQGLPGYEQRFRILRSDGAVIWIRENVTIKPLGGKRFSLVGVAVDITAQRAAEEALAAEKERLAVTLRAMSEAVITTDTAGVVQFINPSAAALLEQDGPACIGRSVQEICVLQSTRSAQAIMVPVARAARGDAVVDLPPQTRLLSSQPGQFKLVEGCCAPIHGADSKVIGTVLVMRDVTAHERLEQELVRATRLESVGVLAGGIAHDFNNILTAVMGNLTLAQLDIDSQTPAGQSLRSAEKAALRARDLTQQLLTFAKGGEPVRAAVQLEAVVREVTDFALHGSQVKAHYDMAPDLWPADVDKGQIGRVVQNLVINSVQAMPRGGSLRISVRNDPQDGVSQPGLGSGDFIQITIADTGEGISPENLSRIFDPYFTTKQTGTGLGLAAVYSIVKKHRGHVDVESTVGRGTTFRIWLPALRDEAAHGASALPWSGARRLSGRVLFMDDEEIIRDMARILFERLGLELDATEDGAEAVERYREALAAGRRYDIVIMDLTVPGGMGGLAALGKLREIDPQVKAVVSSGYSSDPVLAKFREHGFAAVVAKPYEVGELTKVLAELLPGGG